MPLRFTTKEKRDEMAERLVNLARYMLAATDQGHNGTIHVNAEMIGDIQMAACHIGLAEIAAEPQVIGSAQSRGPLGLD